MEIIPRVGNAPISASTVTIQVDPGDRRRAQELVLRTSKILAVSDEESFVSAKHVAGELKAMINEITDSRKAAKRPFAAVGKAIDELALEIEAPVATEQKRILGLLNAYVARLEAAAKEEQRRKDELVAKRVAEARAQAAAALQTADFQAAEEAQLAAEMAKEIANIGEQPKRGLVAGGRVDHPYQFELVDLKACVLGGGARLLRVSIDYRACQDSCRGQLEINPDAEPTLPGIRVSRDISVSVKATARIENR